MSEMPALCTWVPLAIVVIVWGLGLWAYMRPSNTKGYTNYHGYRMSNYKLAKQNKSFGTLIIGMIFFSLLVAVCSMMTSK